MLKQYTSIRKDLPEDVLLFFRLGDFYELFMDDAKETKKVTPDKEFRYTEKFMFDLGQKVRFLERIKLRLWMIEYQKQSNIITS